MSDETTVETPAAGAEGTEKPSYLTAEQANAMVTNRTKALQKENQDLKSRMDAWESKFAPKEEAPPEKKTTAQMSQETRELMEWKQTQLAKQEKTNQKLMQSAVSTDATKVGIPAGVAKALFAQFIQEKKISLDEESGEVVWNDYLQDPVPFSVGFGNWLKTEDGRSFLPQKQAKGAGMGRPGSVGNNSSSSENEKFYETMMNYRNNT